MQRIPRSRIYYESYFVFHFGENSASVRLLFDKLNSVTHQLHQAVIVRELTLAVGNVTYKRRVFLYVPGDIDGAFHVSIVVLPMNILLEQTFS